MPYGTIALIFAGVLFIGMPMGMSLVGAAILPSLFNPRFVYNLEAVIRTLSVSLDSFLLLAIPLFMFSGVIMARGGISEKLFNIFAFFFGTITGGFPFAVILTCLFYGAISGSGPATTAAVGSMTIPYLIKRGYDPVFSASIVAVAGGLGIIIPPSIPMIAYSSIASVSVADMFIGGVLPGILIAVCLTAYSWYYCRTHGEDKAELRRHCREIRNLGLFRLLKDGIWAILAPVIILGSIYGGVATPTEAASLSVYYAIFVSMFVYKTLKWGEFMSVLRETVKTYAPILFVIACAMCLSRVMTRLQVARAIEEMVLAHLSSKMVILLLVNLLLLLAGMIMDPIPAMMIFTPIIMPCVDRFGMSHVHLGIIMVCNLAVGFVTPPLGVNLFVTSNMTGIPVLKLARFSIPFIFSFIAALLLITFVPGVSLILT
ncbi:MAG: TRAP transporter large permease [Planctomycetota bacterium]|jgi:C4-dicarboxylate transporter DctM subunit|nr:TRAP transporter large permease [Planctomycetota bacterium]